MNELDEIKKLAKASHRIVFLGGAGVSTNSGIPDFRSPKGLYNIRNRYGVSYETMLSSDYFYEHTDLFYEFYFESMVYPDAKPNAAHLALANYEKQGHRIAIITQNIDGLHQKAGSSVVYELHGSTYRYHCLDCNEKYGLEDIPHKGIPFCPKCGGLIKPDVVLYGEPLEEDTIVSAMNELRFADLLIVGGTSLNVYPAAGLIDYFITGKKILINIETTFRDSEFDFVIHDDIGSVLQQILA